MSLVPLCHQVHGPYHACLQCHCFSPAVLSPCVPVAQVSPCLHLMGVCVMSRCVCPAVLLSDPKGKGITSLLGTTGARVTRAEPQMGPGRVHHGLSPMDTPMPRPSLCHLGDEDGGWKGSSVL